MKSLGSGCVVAGLRDGSSSALQLNYSEGYELLLARLVIRRGKKSDAPAFLDLLVSLARFEKLEPPTPAARRSILRDVFTLKRAELILAVRDGEAIGYALYFYAYSSFLAKPTLYLEDLFVMSRFRRSGVGTSMFLWCASEARRKGCGRMEWSVLTWNLKALRFYENLGARRLSDWYVYRLDSAGLERLADKTGRVLDEPRRSNLKRTPKPAGFVV